MHDYVTFKIEVDGEKYKWDMKKGSTPDSKFGKIARYASMSGGLEGESVTWIRQGEDTDTSHVLLDLSDTGSSDSEEDEESEGDASVEDAAGKVEDMTGSTDESEGDDSGDEGGRVSSGESGDEGSGDDVIFGEEDDDASTGDDEDLGELEKHVAEDAEA